MLDVLKSLDESLFLFLNGHHNSFFDPLMWLFSEMLYWIPLYAWFLWILYKRYPTHYWTVIIAVALMITVSDQFSNIVKDNVMRLRPSQEPHLRQMVHVLNGYRGGTYGFYSAHASNAFSLALFMITAVARQRKYIIPVSLAYAVLTAYSRIYLGVHYPGDILTAAIVGVFLGTGFALAHDKLRARFIRTKD